MNRIAICLFLVITVSVNSFADDSLYKTFGDEYLLNNDFKEKKWKEGDILLPPFPKTSNLIPLQMEHEKRKFFIDEKSIAISKGGVVSYTVVIESTSGLRNVLFEGIRCDTKQYKTYAYGDLNKRKFNASSQKEWVNIEATTGPYRYRVDMSDVYACESSTAKLKPRDIIQALKYPPQLHAPEMTD